MLDSACSHRGRCFASCRPATQRDATPMMVAKVMILRFSFEGPETRVGVTVGHRPGSPKGQTTPLRASHLNEARLAGGVAGGGPHTGGYQHLLIRYCLAH